MLINDVFVTSAWWRLLNFLFPRGWSKSFFSDVLPGPCMNDLACRIMVPKVCLFCRLFVHFEAKIRTPTFKTLYWLGNKFFMWGLSDFICGSDKISHQLHDSGYLGVTRIMYRNKCYSFTACGLCLSQLCDDIMALHTFHIIDPLCVESIGDRWIHRTKVQ